MGLIKFLVITICVLYLLRLLARVLLPFLFKKAVNKMQEKMNQQQGGYTYQQQPNHQPEGKITVDYIPPQKKKDVKLDDAGEFVDFEEVRDRKE